MAGNEVATRRASTGVAAQSGRTLKDLLEQRTEEFGLALAGRVDPQAFVRVAYTTITKSPKLMEATAPSILMALLECASLGLVPNGVMGEAYLVPFSNKVKDDGRDRWEVQAQFIPGWRGLVKLARNTGVIRNIVARPVFEGDRFEVEYGSTEKLIHVPDLSGDGARRLTHVWALAHFADGGEPQFEIMPKADVDRIRARSKSRDNGPWVTDYTEMARKTVVRRLCKLLPISDVDQSFSRALDADNRDYMDVSEVAAQHPRTRLSERFAAPGALPPVQVQVPDFPPATHPDLDEVGLTGGDAGTPVHTEAGDKLHALQVLVNDTTPTGKAPLAEDDQRLEIQRLGGALTGHGPADRLLELSADPKLSRFQAGLLVSAASAAAEEVAHV